MILIETVGVGQDEVDIVRLADITVVILVPGMGDDVQTIKAGIMEIADIFVINKSDREGAERVEREIRALQSLAVRQDGWTPPIVKTVASEGTGVPELAAAIAAYEAYLQKENLALQKKCRELAGASGRDVARCHAGKSPRAPWQTGTSRAWRRKSPSTSAIRIRWWKRLRRRSASVKDQFQIADLRLQI